MRLVYELMERHMVLAAIASVAGGVFFAERNNEIAFYRCRKCKHFFYRAGY
jgi:hypothetical protein